MAIYFSATTLGFYPKELKSVYGDVNTWPNDAVKITDAVYAQYQQSPPEGKQIGSDGKGQPTWVDIPQPTPEQMRSQAAYRKQSEMAEAEDVIAPLERAVKRDMATDEEKAQLDAWERYSVLLSRVDTDKAPDIVWPDKPE